MRKTHAAILAGLMMLWAAPGFAMPRIMTRYHGGGNYYYNPSHSRGPTGYSGANAPIYRQAGRVRTAATAGAGVGLAAWSRPLLAPCGNYTRVPQRHCPPTKAWDATFRTVYR